MRITTLLSSLALSTALLAANNPRVIRIGVATVGTGNRPVLGGSWFAKTHTEGALEDEFRKDGITVKYTFFPGAGPAVNEALANKQLDFAWQGDLPALVARSGGLRTRIILAANRLYPVYLAVPADSRARSIEDLKGKRIAVFKGTNLQLAFGNFLATRGLKESDFKVINMSTYDGNAALLSKDIDAQLSGADLFPLVDRGTVRIIHSTRSDIRATRLLHLLVTEDFESKYPDLVQRFVTTSLKAAAWFADEANRTKGFQLFANSGLGLSAWQRDYEGQLLRERESPLLDEFYHAHYKRLLQNAIDLKLVRRPFDIDSWLDSRYLNKGIRDLKLEKTWYELDAQGKPKRR